jgi:hypothetical protein
MLFQLHNKQSEESYCWKKKTALCCGLCMKHIRTLCGQNAEFLMSKQIVRCAVQDGYGMRYSAFTRNEVVKQKFDSIHAVPHI